MASTSSERREKKKARRAYDDRRAPHGGTFKHSGRWHVEADLPADFRDAYQRIVKGKGSDAMAAVEGESCGGCYRQLTANVFNSLMMDHVVCCQSCGRMLYLPEDRAPGAGKRS